MSLASMADLRAGLRQRQLFNKSGLTLNIAGSWYSWFQAGTVPAAGGSPGNTTNGVVPTSATLGALPINAFSGVGLLNSIECVINTAMRIAVFDRLYHVGGVSDAAGTVNFSSQPSYSSRVPGGTDFTGLQIWVEGQSNPSGGSGTAVVTYTDQSGNTGHVTPAAPVGIFGTTAGRLFPVQLAAGDCGVQKIEAVTFTGSCSGTANILVLRPIWLGRPPNLNVPMFQSFFQFGMRQIYSDACLFLAGNDDGAGATPGAWAELEIVSG